MKGVTMKATMLTTIDNPFDPFTQYKEWNIYDESHGYYSSSYLARIVKTSNELTEETEVLEIERAIDEIIQLNVLGIYKKVTLD